MTSSKTNNRNDLPVYAPQLIRQAVFAVVIGIVALATSGCGTLHGPTLTPVVLYITATPAPASDTPEASATWVIGPTISAIDLALTLPVLPTATITLVPTNPPPPASLTPSFTPEFTDTPTPKGTKVVAGAGVVIPAGQSACVGLAANGFTTIFQRDPTTQAALGCPASAAVAISSASETFEHGLLLWASAFADQPHKVIYALFANGTYQRYDDNWQDGVSPATTGENPPSNFKVPIRGFGQVWHTNPAVRNGLGWALTDEAGTSGQIQRFARGEMLFVASLNQTYILANGVWRADPTRF